MTIDLLRGSASGNRPAASPAGDDEASDDVDVRSERWSIALLTFLSAATAGVVLHVYSGYLYGYSDHTLLSIKGISWADPTAFRNDWFNERAPQPHWLFDIITYLGELIGHLPAVYFAYHVLTLLAFGLGTAWLAHYWLPAGRRALAIGVAILACIGPRFALGTFLPLESQALPNLFGGCLAYATAAALITKRYRTTCVLAFATGLVHVQHGVVIACILVLAAVMSRAARRLRLELFVTAVALFVMSLGVSWTRGLTAGHDDVIDGCNHASIGHCNANSWPWIVVRDGLLLMVIAVGVAVLRRRDWRTLVPVVVVPAAVNALGFLADRHDVVYLGELAQRLFVYRLGMILALFAPWTAVLLAAGRERIPVLALLRAFGSGMVGWFFAGAIYSLFGGAVLDITKVHWFGFMLGAGLASPMVIEAFASSVRSWRPSRRTMTVLTVSAVATMFVAVYSVALHELQPGGLRIGYADGDGQVELGKQLEAALPVGAVLAHPPEFEWIRLLSRRAVVGNCRAAPYGGPPWQEYKARLSALGVDTTRIFDCNRSGYLALTLDDVVELRQRFDATHVALLGDDPKIAAARAADWKVAWYSGPGSEPWWVFEIPAIGPEVRAVASQ